MPWHTKRTGGYLYTSDEAKDNSVMIYNILHARGWTVEAVAGLLGNVSSESGFNPWRWQGDNVLNSYDDITTQNAHAYGLCQFDPAGKYINYAGSYAGYGPNFNDRVGRVTDGQAQMLFINDHADYYPTTAYPLSYAQYKAVTISEHDMAWITHAWFSNYERGTWDSGRATVGQFYYEYLNDLPPVPPPPTETTKLPLWMMIRINDTYRRRR